MSTKNSLLFLNSVSVLLKSFDEHLLIDPYFKTDPLCPCVNQADLCSLSNLSVLLTHPSKMDEDFLRILNKKVRLILSPVQVAYAHEKLKMLNFKNIIELNYFGKLVGNIHLISFINEDSQEDALFVVRNAGAIVIICHNIHFPFTEALIKILLEERAKNSDGEIILLGEIPYFYNVRSKKKKDVKFQAGDIYYLNDVGKCLS